MSFIFTNQASRHGLSVLLLFPRFLYLSFFLFISFWLCCPFITCITLHHCTCTRTFRPIQEGCYFLQGLLRCYARPPVKVWFYVLCSSQISGTFCHFMIDNLVFGHKIVGHYVWQVKVNRSSGLLSIPRQLVRLQVPRMWSQGLFLTCIANSFWRKIIWST